LVKKPKNFVFKISTICHFWNFICPRPKDFYQLPDIFHLNYVNGSREMPGYVTRIEIFNQDFF